MKILITGGAGFIGSNLAKRLVYDGHEVIVYDSLLRGNKIEPDVFKKLKFVKGDVRNYGLLYRHTKDVDVIFHFAAVLGVDIVADNPVETMDVETIGTRNIVSCAIERGVSKLLYASTSGIYGHSTMEQTISEEIIVDPKTSYAMAKRYNEIYLASVYEERGLNCLSIRFFNVYGYHQDTRMVIPRFFDQAINNQPVTVFGSGKQTRDFTWIDDTIEACIRLMNKVDGNGIFNIANETEECIDELAKLIIRVSGSKSEIRYLDAPKNRYDYEVERRIGSSQKLLDHTGYKPTMQLIDGLKLMQENHQSQGVID